MLAVHKHYTHHALDTACRHIPYLHTILYYGACRLVKPEITFFGENLPMRFFQQRALDFPRADLLIIMGTSLTVSPFCNLVGESLTCGF